MYKIAVMGERDSIYGFAALGLDIFEVKSGSIDGRKVLHRLAEGEYAIIYITELLYAELESEIEKYYDNLTPAIIPIPGVRGNNGLGKSNVNNFVEKAVGTSLI